VATRNTLAIADELCCARRARHRHAPDPGVLSPAPQPAFRHPNWRRTVQIKSVTVWARHDGARHRARRRPRRLRHRAL
jgi:hypothetical protein